MIEHWHLFLEFLLCGSPQLLVIQVSLHRVHTRKRFQKGQKKTKKKFLRRFSQQSLLARLRSKVLSGATGFGKCEQHVPSGLALKVHNPPLYALNSMKWKRKQISRNQKQAPLLFKSCILKHVEMPLFFIFLFAGASEDFLSTVCWLAFPFRWHKKFHNLIISASSSFVPI